MIPSASEEQKNIVANYKENNVNQPLTNKFLEEIFLEYFKNDRETKILMEFIKRKRVNNKKTTFTLKRSLNK